MKRRLAFGIYFVGSLSALSVLVSGLEAGLLAGVGNVMYALAIWWITAGIGIRLGVVPAEFFTSLQKPF
ncbi:MAG: hypothetical protein ACRDJI_04735 [Actinomycetota bacterium]